jgi:hypothetical protein
VSFTGDALRVRDAARSSQPCSDIKPGNILLSADFSTVKLADFGLAHAISASSSKVSSVRGTPLFIAPELADDPQPSVATDVFSFGMTTWQVTSPQSHYCLHVTADSMLEL